MRSFENTRTRWDKLFHDSSTAIDWRQSTIDNESSPIDAGLRSVCWKAFLLYGPISQTTWPKKLSESRSAYTSLREHFLKYIANPNELESNVDPLDDDSSSPWTSLRQDEISREEILQDVQRCMQENYFFREPDVQKRLLDILFIYAKLNPDTGYRQGMHELLAPILWVVDCDAIESHTLPPKVAEKSLLMRLTLDSDFVEHDAFSLFCALMQSLKSFYEPGDASSASPIIEFCSKLQTSLSDVDPELATHLQVIGVLPQVYLIRWIRLLFGREFEFSHVLELWDALFAAKLSQSTLEMMCLVLLLQIRWILLAADYSLALTTLLRYNLPEAAPKPRDLLIDALKLQRDPSSATGATLIKTFSGRLPKAMERRGSSPRPETPPRPQPRKEDILPHHQQSHIRGRSHDDRSVTPSPARFLAQQKNLEAIFSNVSGGLQQKAEAWNVSKAVFGAAGEVRRNLNQIYANASPKQTASSHQVSSPAAASLPVSVRLPTENATSAQSDTAKIEQLTHRINALQSRNKALAAMVEDAIVTLRANRKSSSTDTQSEGPIDDENLNISLARLQFIAVYLADSDISIPSELTEPQDSAPDEEQNTDPITLAEDLDKVAPSTNSPDDSPVVEPTPENPPPTPKRPLRPTLADPTFSFMLGPGRHRSSFVSSVADLPQEARRGSDASSKPPGNLTKSKSKADWDKDKGRDRDRKRETESKGKGKGNEVNKREEDEGFTLHPLHGVTSEEDRDRT